MEDLREFFDAERVMLILQNPEDEGYSMQQVDRKDTCLKEEPTLLTPFLAQLLMSFPANCTTIYRYPQSWLRRESVHCYDASSGKSCVCDPASMRKIGALMGAHFMSIPIVTQNNTVGRLFVLSSHPFSKNDVDFTFETATKLFSRIQYIGMAYRAADEAAEEERRRIARDIHDSIVQPYIGLQLAIKGLRRKINPEDESLMRDIEQLDRMCSEGTQELRSYIKGLRSGYLAQNNLIPAVQQFATKFQSDTGIDVKVESSPNFSIHENLAAHIFQMTVEGLSNVHRHTQADSASVRLGCDKKHLLLQIENSGSATSPVAPEFLKRAQNQASFTPRSISERAHSLGGTVQVETHPNGRAVISVDIPL